MQAAKMMAPSEAREKELDDRARELARSINLILNRDGVIPDIRTATRFASGAFEFWMLGHGF